MLSTTATIQLPDAAAHQNHQPTLNEPSGYAASPVEQARANESWLRNFDPPKVEDRWVGSRLTREVVQEFRDCQRMGR